MSPFPWMLAFSVNMLLSRGEQCGGIVREGDEFTLICTLASLDEDLLWQLQEGAGYVNISSCASGTCTDLLPASFRASRRAVPIPTGETNVGQLKIVSANRTQNLFKCIRPRDVQELCNLQVYVGPSAPTIDLSDANPLCPSESHMYQINCSVPSDTVVPQPLFTIVINNRTVIMNERGQLDRSSKTYRLTHSFRPESGGSIRIYCRAVNEIFKGQFGEHERPYPINEPPRLAPMFQTFNGLPEPGSDIAYVTDGNNVQLRCKVDGGYPKVSSVTIRCGDMVNTMVDTLATMIVNIPNNTRTLFCRCSAKHITGCYDKQTDIFLKLNNTENPDKGDSQITDTNNNSLSLGLGIGLGGVIVLLVVFVIVFIILYKKRDMKVKESRDKQYSQPDCASSATYSYASFLPARPALPQTPPPNQPGQADYDLIIDTDMVPKTLFEGHSVKHESSTDPNPENYGYIQPI